MEFLDNITPIVLMAAATIIGIIVVFALLNTGQNVASATSSQSYTAYTKDFNIGETSIDVSDGNRFVAQTFVATLNFLTTTDLNLGKFASGTKDLNVHLYNTSAGKPTTEVTGMNTVVLASTKTANAKPTPTRITWNVAVTPGAKYAIVMDYNDSYVAGGTDLNYWVVSVKTANPVTDGNMWVSTNGTTWLPIDQNTNGMYLVANFETRTPWDATVVALVTMITIALGAGVIIFAVKKLELA